MRKFYLFIALGVVLLDRITKAAITDKLTMYSSIQIIPKFFRITHVENPGAAFELFANSPSQWKLAILISFSILALGIVTVLLWRNSHVMTMTGVGLSLILGGALGNLWDRLMHGRVVDFLVFYVGQYEWPAFNAADSAIVIGAGLLVFEILFAKTSAVENSAPSARSAVK